MRKLLCLHALGLALAGGAAPARADLLTEAQLNAAQKLYVGKCAKCHRLYEPTRYSDAQWQSWMKKMSKKARLKPDQQELLTLYIEQVLRHPAGETTGGRE